MQIVKGIVNCETFFYIKRWVIGPPFIFFSYFSNKIILIQKNLVVLQEFFVTYLYVYGYDKILKEHSSKFSKSPNVQFYRGFGDGARSGSFNEYYPSIPVTQVAKGTVIRKFTVDSIKYKLSYVVPVSFDVTCLS